MKRTNKTILEKSLFALALMGLVTGCEKDIYNPDNDRSKLPPIEDYFDFNLKGEVQLNVNYGVPGLRALIEVYDENPMLDHKTKKEGVSPKYAAFTDVDGHFSGKINIPTAMTEAYLYTSTFGLPTCVKMEISADGFSYDLKRAEASTRAVQNGVVTDKFPYKLTNAINSDSRSRADNTYSLTTWDLNGVPNSKDYIKSLTESIGEAKEKVGTVSDRVVKFLGAQRKIDKNKSLLRTPAQVNLTIPETATEGVSVSVTFMGEQAQYLNTFGYYYYKGTTGLAPNTFLNTKKYVVFPNVECSESSPVLTVGNTAQLKYFDEQGNAFDEFPAGYSIGWFVISNGFRSEYGSRNGFVNEIGSIGYTSGFGQSYSGYRTTCMSDDLDADRRFISVYDQKSKLYVVGIEDNVRATEPDDYMDVLFLVQTSADLGGENELAPIPPTDPEPETGEFSVSGTLAFEDIWPKGGDYDLNDVIVEYERKMSFDEDNKVTKVVETFKPVHKKGSAIHNNYFACQYNMPGTLKLSEGMISEAATNSVVISESALTISGKTYVVERDLTGKGLTQSDIEKDFNPYIITGTYAIESRTEVHLPLKEMTTAANKSLMNRDNAYFVSEDKKYPFAINIPITGFIPADETKRIDLEGQYPNFKSWAESNGNSNQDWYHTGKGKK